MKPIYRTTDRSDYLDILFEAAQSAGAKLHLLGHDSPPVETRDIAYRGTFSRASLENLRDAEIAELCAKNKVTV